MVFYNCNLRDADFKDAIFENVVFICTNFKEVKNLDFDNPEINILKTYNRIDLNSAVESRLLALTQNDSIFDARVLHVNKNKLNHWVLSLLNAKYGDKAILFLSKLLPKKEKWNNMYTIYSYMQLIENLMKASYNILSLTVVRRKNRCIHCVYLVAAIFAVVLKYSNLFLPFTFFLYCFHFALCYKLIVCPKTTAFMKSIRNLFAFIQRDKSLFLYFGKIHCL